MKKKGLSVFLMLILICPVFSQNIPDELFGLWEGKDRFVLIDKSSQDDAPQLFIVLKEFYGWYYDRTVEPAEAAEIQKRTRNDATPRKGEEIGISFKELSKVVDGEGAWEIVLEHSKSEKSFIPVAVCDNKMYLDFFYKELSEEDLNLIKENKYVPVNDGLYRGVSVSKGITVNYQEMEENIGALKVSGENIFNIRYWQTDMDYVEETVTYKRGKYEFPVYKHLLSGNTNYSCVSGRSKKVRNPVGPQKFNPENYIFTNYKTILIRDEKPYLVRIADKNTFDDLIQLVKTENSRKAPSSSPQFPVRFTAYQWQILEDAELFSLEFQKILKRNLPVPYKD